MISTDDILFERLGRAYVTRFVSTVALVLHRSPAADFDVHAPEAPASDLLFDLCFLGVAQMEERSGLDDAGRRYFPLATFETGGADGAPRRVIEGAALLHGMVEEPLISAAVELARASAAGEPAAAVTAPGLGR
ncbi:hypothetical protein [Rubrimonas cliftonensis]|uniref:Uncharacterized protein n=1 Tax=Rubrimonas cliftonensis TaxID=89524 RepID=A0A1H4EL50_9RHOB|nr:hypothetical protein [Rubrimonas cliftonensis]SEA85636.1 hypothetical protein SAMN05444370_11481 [Rubrimonas cliftonensis]